MFDIFLNSKLREEDIAVEKGVIVEEINMYRDLPQRYVGELFEKLLYGDQPAGWDTAGEKEIVTALKQDDFVNYFHSHYVAGNTIVAVAGNVDRDYVKNRTGDLFKNIRHSEPFSKLKVTESQSSPQVLVHYKKTDQTHFHLGFRSIDMFSEQRYAIGLLGHVLGGGMSSRLFDEIREKRHCT